MVLILEIPIVSTASSGRVFTHMRTLWNNARVEKEQGKICMKQKILISLAVCMVNYFCRMNYFQSSLFSMKNSICSRSCFIFRPKCKHVFSRKLFSINQELYTLRLKNYESTKTYFHIHRPGQYIHSTQI